MSSPCPFCAEETDEGAGKCNHCGEFLEERPPISSRPSRVLIGLAVFVGLGGLCLAVGVVVLLTAPHHSYKSSNHATAIGGLKTIGAAQAVFREGDKEDDQVFDYGDLRDLNTANLVDPILGAGTKRGYVFDTQPSSTTPEFLWFATANPGIPTTTGDRYFATNHEGVIYYSNTASIPMNTADCTFPADRIASGDLMPVGR